MKCNNCNKFLNLEVHLNSNSNLESHLSQKIEIVENDLQYHFRS